MIAALLLAVVFQSIDSLPPHRAPRTTAIDERLAADANIKIGDKLVLSVTPGSAMGDTVVVSALVRRRADPSEVARAEYRVRLH